MQPCDACASNGIIPYTKRKIRLVEDGELVDDPADFKTHTLCEKCGGGGMVPLDKSRVKESGNIVDSI